MPPHDDEEDHYHDYERDSGEEVPDGFVPDFYKVDNVELTTVGIDIGTATSHLMFSRLHLQRLGQSSSSRFAVVERTPLYGSAILLTPYKPDYTIDAERLHGFIDRSYGAAGLTPDQIDTGAIILTGEAVKRTNARAIADLFSAEAGKFVCASAGPNLEAVMAAHGSGAVAFSRGGQTVLNVDVGGGTAKLSLVRDGEVVETAAINVGGRLVALEGDRVVRIEPAARQVADALGVPLQLSERLAPEAQRRFAEALAGCLFEMIQRGDLSDLSQGLLLTPPLSPTLSVDAVVFSGGVSEYIYHRETREFGDLAPHLAQAILERIDASALPGPLLAASERIRATVIGASQFTVQLSGSTIYVSRPEMLPIHNLPVLAPRLPQRERLQPQEVSDAIRRSIERFDLDDGEQAVALAIDWEGTPRYELLRSLADGIVAGLPRAVAAGLPLTLVFANDHGEIVGQILRHDLGLANDVVSIDCVELGDFDYIDIGEKVEPAGVVPVVIKSLLFPEAGGARAELAEIQGVH